MLSSQGKNEPVAEIHQKKCGSYSAMVLLLFTGIFVVTDCKREMISRM